MADRFKTQDYYSMLTHIVHELPQSKPGDLFNERSIIYLFKKFFKTIKKINEVYTCADVLCLCSKVYQSDTASQEIQIALLPINISVIIFNKIYVFKV